jgi:hypothetical protein
MSFQSAFPEKAIGLACSDWHGHWIVSKQTEVIGTPPRAEMFKIGALQRVRAFSRMDLHVIGTLLARTFVTPQRVLCRGGLREASSEHHPILDCHNRALAKKGEVGCAASPSVETRPIVHCSKGSLSRNPHLNRVSGWMAPIIRKAKG